MPLPHFLTDKPGPTSRLHRVGMGVPVLVLLALNVWDVARLGPKYPPDHFNLLVIFFMLLLNYLAFQFRYPPKVTAVMRILAFSWALLGLVYVVYLGGFLFPGS